MIESNESFIESFEINNIYKKDYIKVFTIYAQDFEYFSKTISSLTKRLNKYRIDDNNLSKFLGFYWKFIKICNALPISISDCSTLIETNSITNIKKIKDILCVAYPDYEKEFDNDIIMIMTKKEELSLSKNISVTARYIINNSPIPVMNIRPKERKHITGPTTAF